MPPGFFLFLDIDNERLRRYNPPKGRCFVLHEQLEDKVETLARWIKESNRIVFFGGAGVSEESGIKTFRGENGLYNEKMGTNRNASTEGGR